MNDDACVATWDVLPDFGFEPDADVLFSDRTPGLSFDFGNLRLSARSLISMHFAEVVQFTGVLTTPRTMAEVDFELPRRVTSREQCVALIVYNLDKAAAGGVFHPARDVGWVIEGRKNQNLLPWIVDSTAYRARPCCMVQRDWLRLALKTLEQILATAEDEAAVVFGFDGAVLTIRCAGKRVAISGEGAPWPQEYSLPASQLRNLPKRLMSNSLGVSLWEGKLLIGNRVYSGVVDAPKSIGPREQQ